MEPPFSGAMSNTERFGMNQRTDDAMFTEHRPGDTDPPRPTAPSQEIKDGLSALSSSSNQSGHLVLFVG